MSKPETTLRTRFGTLAMFCLEKKVSKITLKMSCMYQALQRIWSPSAKLLSKGCKFDLIKAVASSKKRADSSHVDEDRAKCSFSIHAR